MPMPYKGLGWERGGLLRMGTESSGRGSRGQAGAYAVCAKPASPWLALACAALVACDGPPDRTPTLGDADTDRGRRVVVDKGCAACHAFPDVKWPRGGLGPALENFGRQGLIAGRLPNQPGVLMQFVRNAPALVPGTAMPAVAMSDQEARDVTAYLLALGSR
jgi:cytochrome c1